MTGAELHTVEGGGEVCHGDGCAKRENGDLRKLTWATDLCEWMNEWMDG